MLGENISPSAGDSGWVLSAGDHLKTAR